MISVIVPVYNVEKYLERCIDSIVNQTYKDFELILVDDGSTDLSSMICDEYKKKYEFINVIHKENGGLSDARNVGVSYAIGNYIAFIDSDDYVHKDYLKVLDGLIRKYNSTIAAVGDMKFYDNKEFNPPRIECKHDYCITGNKALCDMLYQKGLDTHAWGLLIPIEFARKYEFPKGKFHEDEYITYNYYFNSHSVAISEAKLYYYFQRENSIMHMKGNALLDELDAADNLVEFCRKNAPYALNAAQSKKFSDYCQVLFCLDKNKQKEIYDRVKTDLNILKTKIVFDKNVRTKNRIAAIVLFGGCSCLNRLNLLINKITTK